MTINIDVTSFFSGVFTPNSLNIRNAIVGIFSKITSGKRGFHWIFEAIISGSVEKIRIPEQMPERNIYFFLMFGKIALVQTVKDINDNIGEIRIGV